MNVTTTTDQAECQLVLTTLEAVDSFKPIPPHKITDGFLKLDDSSFICGTNDHGRLTLHFIEDCTQAEALEFYEEMRGDGKHINPRISFCGPLEHTTTARSN
jgi:hypothetical protein